MSDHDKPDRIPTGDSPSPRLLAAFSARIGSSRKFSSQIISVDSSPADLGDDYFLGDVGLQHGQERIQDLPQSH